MVYLHIACTAHNHSVKIHGFTVYESSDPSSCQGPCMRSDKILIFRVKKKRYTIFHDASSMVFFIDDCIAFSTAECQMMTQTVSIHAFYFSAFTSAKHSGMLIPAVVVYAQDCPSPDFLSYQFLIIHPSPPSLRRMPRLHS